jgi:Lytic transglycolase
MYFTRDRRYSSAQSSSSTSNRKTFQLFAIAAVVSGGLSACAPTSFVNEKSELGAPGRYASSRNHAEKRLATEKRATGIKLTALGVASFYTEGTRTASGEKFDPQALTAAHPTLPFGTRLRVTYCGRLLFRGSNARDCSSGHGERDNSGRTVNSTGVFGRTSKLSGLTQLKMFWKPRMLSAIFAHFDNGSE